MALVIKHEHADDRRPQHPITPVALRLEVGKLRLDFTGGQALFQERFVAGGAGGGNYRAWFDQAQGQNFAGILLFELKIDSFDMVAGQATAQFSAEILEPVQNGNVPSDQDFAHLFQVMGLRP